ncbi:MAG: prepilin-type N-terminal cleavage/methylation domain-containing protein [Thermodesulfovibrionia bacterium]|nr:prepilin-type N-terminal cleavage/methylation domain-containing protein [Thermodesulfovibrionia bacterium]
MLTILKLNKKQGFSLVELSIVLVIIGLLIAALVKGKAVLENARIKRVIGDVETIVSAYNTYYDLYSAYPGDDKFASGRWSTLVTLTDTVNAGNALIGGTLCNTGPADGTECNEAWQELRAALMVQGDPLATGASALPTHTLGGIIWLWNSADDGIAATDFGISGVRNYIGVTNLRSEVAEVIDNKFDDGIYNSGSVRGSADYSLDPETIVEIYYAL